MKSNNIWHVIETDKESGKRYLWATCAGTRDEATEAMNTVYPADRYPRTRGTFEVVDEVPAPCYLAGNDKQIR